MCQYHSSWPCPLSLLKERAVTDHVVKMPLSTSFVAISSKHGSKSFFARSPATKVRIWWDTHGAACVKVDVVSAGFGSKPYVLCSVGLDLRLARSYTAKHVKGQSHLWTALRSCDSFARLVGRSAQKNRLYRIEHSVAPSSGFSSLCIVVPGGVARRRTNALGIVVGCTRYSSELQPTIGLKHRRSFSHSSRCLPDLTERDGTNDNCRSFLHTGYFLKKTLRSKLTAMLRVACSLPPP